MQITFDLLSVARLSRQNCYLSLLAIKAEARCLLRAASGHVQKRHAPLGACGKEAMPLLLGADDKRQRLCFWVLMIRRKQHLVWALTTRRRQRLVQALMTRRDSALFGSVKGALCQRKGAQRLGWSARRKASGTQIAWNEAKTRGEISERKEIRPSKLKSENPGHK